MNAADIWGIKETEFIPANTGLLEYFVWPRISVSLYHYEIQGRSLGRNGAPLVEAHSYDYSAIGEVEEGCIATRHQFTPAFIK